MPVNDFEKQVQQKLDELQLRPSPGVWTDVEKQIRKEKKRRRVIIFWWLLPVLLTGAGATYYFTQVDTSKSPISTRQPADQIGTKTTNDKSTPGLNESSGTKPSQEINQTGTSNINTPADAITNKKPGGSNGISQPTTTQGTDQLIVSSQVPGLKKKKKKPVVDKVAEPLTTPEQETGIVQLTPGSQSPSAEAKINPEQKKEEQVTNATIATDSNTTIIPEEKKEIVANEPVPVQSESPAPIKVSRKKWQFGIELRPGLSNTIEGKLFEGQKSMDVFSAPNVNPGANFSVGPFAPPVLITYPEKGFSAALEVFARKALSKRLEFQGGLQYQYLSTYIEVGSRVETSRQVSNDMSSVMINNYFNAPNTGTGNHSYTNQYHVIGLTAGISWNIINKKKFTLSWDNGFTYGRLIATNALLFDRISRSYYQDFSAFRKTQFSLNTGLSFPVWNSKAFTLAIHPFASYTLSPVLKQSEQNMQFVNYGIGFKFLFPRKK